MNKPHRIATETSIVVAGRPVTLARAVRKDFAQRLVVLLPQLTALNAAGKSQKDAADALGVSVPLLRNWLEITGTKWSNLQPRAPYSRS
jgi:hypothetical protein